MRRSQAPRAASPPPVASVSSPTISSAPTQPNHPVSNLQSGSVATTASTLAAQKIPSALVWIAFSAAIHLYTPSHPSSVSYINKMSALVLGILLALSSANIIPKLGHHVLLFVTVPLHVVHYDFSRVVSIFGSLFLYSNKVIAPLSKFFSIDQQHAISFLLLLLVIYALSSQAQFGRHIAVSVIYSSIGFFIFTSSSFPALRAATALAILSLLALHQMLNAPSAPPAYRNIFIASIY
jgi:hypothetical protein